MPVKSKAQRRLMYAILGGKVKKKNAPSKEVASEFLQETPKGKIPERVKRKKRG